MKFQHIFKKLIPHLIAVLVFVVVSSVYFYPAWEGKSLQGEDVVGSSGKWRERNDYVKYENKKTLWLGTIFSGMPEYVSAPYKGATNLGKIFNFPQKMGMPLEVASLFWYMLGFYILLVACGMNPWLAIGGSLIFAFTSYNSIIIQAGHYKKINTIALIAPTLAGILLCFRKKYMLGFILTTFFLAMQINMAHIQMIYYFLIVLVCFGAVELFFHVKEKKFSLFIKSISVIILAALLGIAPNFAKLSNYYKYNKESIRGKSELTIGNEGVKTEKGLDRDYINSWSSGVDESMMIFAPNVKGGSTGTVKSDKKLRAKLPKRNKQFLSSMNKYWGNQPFSGGPIFFGVVVLTLFLIGLFIIKGKLKIWVLIVSILMLFLSWGGNFSIFTDLFIDYVPLYNKFRAPVSILGVLIILAIFFSIYTVHNIIQEPELLAIKKDIKILKKPKPLYLTVIAGFIGFALLNISFPELFNNYISDNEQTFFDAQIKKSSSAQIYPLIETLKDFRISVFRADLWRTIIFTILTGSVLFFYAKRKIKPLSLIILICLLAIVDVWSVSKRYVPNEKFTKKNLTKEANALSNVDRNIYQYEIKADTGIKNKLAELNREFKPKNVEEKEALLRFAVQSQSHFRVYNLTRNPFNENFTSAAHRSIGGYHAVKLRRYQDMIEHHISKNNTQVLNMLNTKYYITQKGLQINSRAMGHAWFVDSVHWVENANDEILALNKIDVKSMAVINTKDKNEIPEFSTGNASDKIELVSYNPDRMLYETEVSDNRLTVFSEVYYPDWKATIDGKEATIFTANYILRALVIPKGKHKIEFSFKPDFFYWSNQISQLAYYLFLIVIPGLICWSIYKGNF